VTMALKMKILKSPYRYPGAKSRLMGNISPYLHERLENAKIYAEPFIGGGSVFLHTISHFGINPGISFRINDRDEAISSFWKTLLSKDMTNKLTGLIAFIDATVKEHDLQRKAINSTTSGIVEKAFAGLFLNRTSFSGILTSGPIGGRNQESKWTVDCRYNQAELIAKIRTIGKSLPSDIDVLGEDFESFLGRFEGKDTVAYCDPPYYDKGDQLYKNKMSHEDHERLALFLKESEIKFVVSYDNVPEIREMYEWAKIETFDGRYSIQGSGRTGWREAKEIIIVR